MDYNQDIQLTLAVSSEQLDTINHLFAHYNWTYTEISRSERPVPGSSSSNASHISTQTESTDDEDDTEEVPFVIRQNQDESDCPYCLC